MKTRPKWVALHKLFDQRETEIFKIWFKDWHRTSIDQENQKKSLIQVAKSLKVDVRALYARPPDHEVSSFVIEETMTHANSMLQSMTAFVYHHGKFVTLPKHEWGHFHTEDAYVFLCVYQSCN